MRHKSNNKTRPLFTLSLEMTRLVNETRLLLVPCFNSDIQSNLPYPGALGLGGARNSDLSVSQNTIYKDRL